MEDIKPPTDATLMVVLALIRALHRKGILPAQAVAEVLDLRATNAMLRGVQTEKEHVIQRTAAMLQTIADAIEREHPFQEHP